jgi:hypothetical protein
MAKKILIHLGNYAPISVTDLLHSFEGLEYEIIDDKREVAEFVVFLYNKDNHSTLEEAMEAGNYSEIEITPERLKNWTFIKHCIECGSMEYSTGVQVEIHYNSKCIYDACDSQNLPSDLEKLIPEYDQVYCVVIGSEDETFHQLFVGSSEEAMLDKVIEWADDDVLKIQATKNNILDEQKYALLFKRSREDAISGGLKEKKEFYNEFFQGFVGYYWTDHYEAHTLDTNYKAKVQEAQKKRFLL